MPSITRRSVDPDRRASVEAEIVAATVRLLTEGVSFTELGVQRIAAEAGVARSTFYTHFRDKSALLMRLAGTMRTTGYDIVSTWQITDGLDGLIDIFQRITTLYREYAVVLTAINEVAAYDTTVREFWAAGSNRFLEFGGRILAEEQQAGRTPADLDVPTVNRIIVIGGERAIADHVATTDDSSGDDAFGAELAKLWWYGAFRRQP
ncbi:TetR/AcrR family transcriptional regulator [Micromonospora sp. NBC_01796]|uniref:TetR/AcrR family transcriptional regulator n=1 Tax=Micromonospora sp. NBC_01796 TaxID=2975987 RepID=UPI002DDAE048|nr:helix-turn-helix domain-containing protein [Micromonospora sp. NBC_01796]WSA88209.1 TetR/AcrR family transcriptional regulator [Micromonospora sp. NBC_01796]